MFITGRRLAKPQRDGGGEDEGSDGDKGEFVGKEHPTYFRFKKRPNSDILRRDCEFGRRCRIDFETDVVNDYFSRNVNQGRFLLEVLENEFQRDKINWNLTLHNGIAHVSIDIAEEIAIGEEMTIQFTVLDDVISEPFVNIAILKIKTQIKREGGNVKHREKEGGDEGEQEKNIGIELPKIIKVQESEWNVHKFDRYSACRIVQDFDENNENKDVYQFYINIDNVYLLTDMKQSGDNPKLLEAKFIYGNVLIGLGLIKDYRSREERAKSASDEQLEQTLELSVDEHVAQTTQALSAFILPMINRLGSLTEEDVAELGQTGDDE